MFKVQQNRYLWVHLVGLAAVPLLLDICLAGLASARPASPFKLQQVQFWAIALIGIVPSAWMQIQRPFYLYALPPLALKPSALSEEERRALTVLTSWQMKALAGVTAGFSLWLLGRLYDRLPQISPAMEPKAGLVIAIAAFFFACLFLQISVSVLRSLLIGQDTLQRVQPFEPSKIASSFLIPGLRVNQILPTATTVSDSLRSEPYAKPIKTSNVAPVERPLEQSVAPEAEEISVDTDGAKTEIAAPADLEPQINAEKFDKVPSEPISPEISETAAEPISEDPPLVIPEIVESDDFEAKDNR